MNRDLIELTSHCIRCGLCLESCPTFAETGHEAEGPRGRIYLVRSAAEGRLAWDDAAPHLDRCLGCRACETACPSAVEYGAILELARGHLKPKLGTKLLLKAVTTPALLKLQAKSPIRRLPGGQADLPVPQSQAEYPVEEFQPPRGEVVLLRGCAMDVLFSRVHQATIRLLNRVGFAVREVSLGCCGALHGHNGAPETGDAMARALLAKHPSGLPLIVNSAGCGSHLKALSQQVFDASEFLAREGLADFLRRSPGLELTITYHDACHLSHGQRITAAPRDLLRAIPGSQYVELSEADRCCGSAGIYNVLHPKMARTLLERKWRHVEATGAQIVATGNPGCHAWIAQAAREHGQRVEVLHTMELLEASFSGLGPITANRLKADA